MDGQVLLASSAPNTATQLNVPSIGHLADEFCAAFGYIHSARLTFAEAYDSVDCQEDFVTFLNRRGMASNEASFLWILIESGFMTPRSLVDEYPVGDSHSEY